MGILLLAGFCGIKGGSDRSFTLFNTLQISKEGEGSEHKRSEEDI